MVAYVWDVFDRHKDRAQRVSDSLQVTGDNSDPWRIVGEAALDSVAAKSADDFAGSKGYGFDFSTEVSYGFGGLTGTGP